MKVDKHDQTYQTYLLFFGVFSIYCIFLFCGFRKVFLRRKEQAEHTSAAANVEAWFQRTGAADELLGTRSY